MNKVLLVIIAILVLALGGLMFNNSGCSTTSEISGTVTTPSPSPPPPPSEQETQQGGKKPGAFTVTLPSFPPGIDPVSGKPLSPETQTPSQPQSFGVPPQKELEPKMGKDYPFVLKTPAGTEGLITIRYNFVVRNPQVYEVDIQVFNNNNRPLEKFYYNEFLKDASGNILLSIKDAQSSLSAPIGPKETVVIKTSRTSVPPGFATSPQSSWTVEIEITYISFL